MRRRLHVVGHRHGSGQKSSPVVRAKMGPSLPQRFGTFSTTINNKLIFNFALSCWFDITVILSKLKLDFGLSYLFNVPVIYLSI